MLGASFIMTGIRALVRRGLAREPLYASIPDDFELAWLALRTVRDDWDDFLITEAYGHRLPPPREWRWGILTGLFEPRFSNGALVCDLAITDDMSLNFTSTLADIVNYVRQLRKMSN